jgi:hypothetical protein
LWELPRDNLIANEEEYEHSPVKKKLPNIVNSFGSCNIVESGNYSKDISKDLEKYKREKKRQSWLEYLEEKKQREKEAF